MYFFGEGRGARGHFLSTFSKVYRNGRKITVPISSGGKSNISGWVIKKKKSFMD